MLQSVAFPFFFWYNSNKEKFLQSEGKYAKDFRKEA